MRSKVKYNDRKYYVSCYIFGPMATCYYRGMASRPDNICVDGSGPTIRDAIADCLEQVPDSSNPPTDGCWTEAENNAILADPVFLDRVEQTIIESLTNEGIDVDQSAYDRLLSHGYEEYELGDKESFDSYFFAQVAVVMR